MRIGTLVKISGQVVRTHPVHPELVGTHTRTHTHMCNRTHTHTHTHRAAKVPYASGGGNPLFIY